MNVSEAVEIRDFQQLDLGRLYSYAEYITWSFKERVELLRGKVVKMSPAPSLRHQEKILTVVQPDLCAICDHTKLDEHGCLGAPHLVVEILSPASANKDVKDKYQLYEEAGVSEYWIIHPEEKLLEIFALCNYEYVQTGLFSSNGTAKSTVIPRLEVNLTELFA